VQVEEGRLQPLDELAAHVEEPRPARPAQELASGRGEDVATDRADVHRHLPHRLARVEHQGHAGGARHLPDRGGGVDQAAVRRHVDERDEPDPLVEHARERLHVDLPGLVVGRDLDRGAGPLGDLAQRDVVARVLGARGQDPVPRTEPHGVEGHVPRAGGVLDERHLVAGAAEEGGDRLVGALDALAPLLRRLVRADGRLAPQVVDRGLEHGLRRQRGPGVVQVRHPLAPRRLGSGAGHVDAPGGARRCAQTPGREMVSV
jgi:hypothetical protein